MTRSTNMEHVEVLRVLRDRWAGPDERVALDAAITSLSAPQPPAEAQPVGEAGTLPGSNGGFTTAVFKASDVPVGTKLYTAPPSAPVGVEGHAKDCLHIYPLPTGEGYWHCTCGYGEDAALVQQPAAVDGAVVGQASGFIEFDYSDDDNCACCPGKHAYCRRVKWDGQSAKDMVDEFARKHANEGKRVLVTLTVAGQQGGEK